MRRQDPLYLLQRRPGSQPCSSSSSSSSNSINNNNNNSGFSRLNKRWLGPQLRYPAYCPWGQILLPLPLPHLLLLPLDNNHRSSLRPAKLLPPPQWRRREHYPKA